MQFGKRHDKTLCKECGGITSIKPAINISGYQTAITVLLSACILLILGLAKLSI